MLVSCVCKCVPYVPEGTTLYVQKGSLYSFEYIKRRRLIYASNLSSTPSLTSKRSKVTCARSIIKSCSLLLLNNDDTSTPFCTLNCYFCYTDLHACALCATPPHLCKKIRETGWRRDQGPLNCDPLCTTLFKHLQPVNNNVKENKPIAFKSKISQVGK